LFHTYFGKASGGLSENGEHKLWRGRTKGNEAMPKQETSAAAASKTYRLVNKRLARTIGTRVSHSQYPSDDFKGLLDQVDDKAKAMALRWYELGIKRGVTFASDQMLDGKITLAKDVLTAPETLVVKVRTRFKGDQWRRRTFRIKAEDVGFDS